MNFRPSRFFGGVVLVLAAVLVFSLAPSLRRGAVWLLRPVWQGTGYLGRWFAVGLGSVRRQGGLAAENQELRRRVDELRARLLAAERLAAENRTLRERFGLVPQAASPPRLARVISHPYLNPYDVINIDLGESNSAPPVRAGELVFAEGPILLGEVVEVYGQSARVRLFSSPGIDLAVQIGPPEAGGVPAMARGRGGGSFVAVLPRGVEIAEGALVWAPQLWPEAIVGEVAAVEKNPTDSLQQVFFRFPLNLNQLQWVGIAANGD